VSVTVVAVGREAWVGDAACRRFAGLFVNLSHEAPDDRQERERLAKLLCARCPVRGECLAYALRVREPLGIWGGLNESERRDLLA
jgi:WhiB family redox-sensing transcriptional regulator